MLPSTQEHFFDSAKTEITAPARRIGYACDLVRGTADHNTTTATAAKAVAKIIGDNIMKKRASFLRLARRVLAGAETLTVPARIELFEDVALILPPVESQIARDAAFTLREGEKQQQDFLALLK
jgi:hypothetical protein